MAWVSMNAMRPSTEAVTKGSGARRVKHANMSEEEVRSQEQRRAREEETKELTSQWFVGGHVVQLGVRHENLKEVSVRCGADHIVRTEYRHVRIQLPINTKRRVWRPRVGKLLWNKQSCYFYPCRQMMLALGGSRVPALQSVLCHEAYQRDCEERAAQCIERALNSIYSGEAKASNATLQPLSRLQAEATRVAGRAPKRKRASDMSERINDELVQMKRIFREARKHSRAVPGFYTAEAETQMLRAYQLARQAHPERVSQVMHVPMRIACAVYVLLPQLAPFAPDSRTADVLADHAHARLQADEKLLMDKLWEHTRALRS